jgi:UDP-3-O-acyl-N-acetylglucosamine deacetylase
VLSARPGDPLAPTVQTVEHVMSALAGLGVTDALVEVTGPEIPIGDGSARPFVETISGAGLAAPTLDGAEEPVRIEEPVVIGDAAAKIEALPSSDGRIGLELTYRLEYPPGAPIPPQEASIFIPLGEPAAGYGAEVSGARTFCLAQEAEMMRKAGMFAHLSPKDMLVIGPAGPIDNAYRFPNEPARHKLLDLVGDLALCGRPVIGRVVATRTGHAHNHAMARALGAL